MPVMAYLAVADSVIEHPAGESAAKKALDLLREAIEPAVIAEEEGAEAVPGEPEVIGAKKEEEEAEEK